MSDTVEDVVNAAHDLLGATTFQKEIETQRAALLLALSRHRAAAALRSTQPPSADVRQHALNGTAAVSGDEFVIIFDTHEDAVRMLELIENMETGSLQSATSLQGVDGWRPIESAPLHESVIVGGIENGISPWSAEAQWDYDANGWWLAGCHPTDAHDGQVYPTLWQPMPCPASPLPGGRDNV